jgi:PST family polysaccharide transporter
MTANPRRLSRSLSLLTWSTIGLGTKGVAQFAVLAVLARFLDPGEFGVVSATLIVIGLGRVVNFAIIGPALVQRPTLRDAHVSSAFALGLYFATALTAMMWLAAAPTAQFFGMQDVGLADVMRALSVVLVLEALGVVPEALLQRDLDLRGLARAELACSLLGFVPVGIGMAVAGFGLWALVGSYFARALIKTVVLIATRPHAYSLLIDRAATREILYFSGGFVPGQLFNYSASEADNFVVGKWMGAPDLGIYGRAYQLMAMPAMFLGEVIDRILFPVMARYQSDVQRLALTYSRGVALTASIMVPAGALGIVLAPEIVRVVLGPDWDPTVGPFRILIAGLLFRAGCKIADSLARATGTVYARMWRQGVYVALVACGALVGVAWGVEGVATGVLFALGVNYALMAWLSALTTGLSWSRFAALHVRGLTIAIACGLLAWAIAQPLRDAHVPAWAILTAAAVSPCAVFVLAAWRLPPQVMGQEGLWLVHQLTGRGR